MSSIVRSSTGLRRIEFFVDGKRHKIRLGRMPESAIQKLQVRIDALCEARVLGARDADAEKWCLKLSLPLRERLMELGLLPRRRDEAIGGLIEMFYRSRTHVKRVTIAADKQAMDSLLAWFGDAKLIQGITPIDAQEWAEDLEAGPSNEEPNRKKLAPATVAKRIIKAKSLFAKAVKPWKLIETNPFDGLHVGSQKNDERMRFITREMATAVLNACPNAEWRALFTMARYGGVRIPSEIAKMKWSDVIWDRNRFRIESPKTAHHEGQDERLCPLFPEVHAALIELQETLQDGADNFVFSAPLRKAPNLRTRLTKIIRRAGLPPWPRLFQNLRSSRETELTETFPEHLVCAWLGNSPKTFRKHYSQMLDTYFEQAAQKPAQQAGASRRIANIDTEKSVKERNPDAAMALLMGGKGLDTLLVSLTKLLNSNGCGAKSGALAKKIVDLLHLSTAPLPLVPQAASLVTREEGR